MSRKFTINVSKLSRVRMALAALFLKGTISDFLGVLCKATVGQRLTIIDSIVTIVATVVLLFGLIEVLQKHPRFFLSSLLSFVMIWYISGLLHPETQIYLNDNISQFFLTCLPYMWLFYYLFGKACSREQRFSNVCYVFRIGIKRTAIALLSQTLMFIIPRSDIYNDYMTASYTILIGAIFVLAYCEYLKPKSIYPKFLAALSPIYMLLLGCRGALVFYLAFMFLFPFLRFNDQPLTNNSAVKKTGIIIALIAMIILMQPAAQLLVSMGLGSHSIELIASGSLFSDNIRMDLYGLLISAVIVNPWGYGVFADRILIPQSHLFWEITYAHNILIELCVDFGFFIGVFVFILLIVLIVRALWKCDSDVKVMVLALFCVSFLKLLVSSSLWQEQMFYALLGCVFAGNGNIKKMKED